MSWTKRENEKSKNESVVEGYIDSGSEWHRAVVWVKKLVAAIVQHRGIATLNEHTIRPRRNPLLWVIPVSVFMSHTYVRVRVRDLMSEMWSTHQCLYVRDYREDYGNRMKFAFVD